MRGGRRVLGGAARRRAEACCLPRLATRFKTSRRKSSVPEAFYSLVVSMQTPPILSCSKLDPGAPISKPRAKRDPRTSNGRG